MTGPAKSGLGFFCKHDMSLAERWVALGNAVSTLCDSCFFVTQSLAEVTQSLTERRGSSVKLRVYSLKLRVFFVTQSLTESWRSSVHLRVIFS